MSKFIEELKNSKYLSNILNERKVILLYVSGSRIIDATDDRSDFDLIAVVDENCKTEKEEYLTYNGRKVHWYYNPLSNFISARGSGLRSVGAVLFANISEDKIIYANPEYEAVWKLLLANKDYIAMNGVYEIGKTYSKLINSIAEYGSVSANNYTKILSHLCVTSLFATGKPLDSNAKDMICQIKRIRWQPVSENAKMWCVERIIELQRWLQSNPQPHISL